MTTGTCNQGVRLGRVKANRQAAAAAAAAAASATLTLAAANVLAMVNMNAVA